MTGFSCLHCGEPIGAYEPIVWHHPDGTSEPCGLLAVLDRAGEDDEPQLIHAPCFEAWSGRSGPDV